MSKEWGKEIKEIKICKFQRDLQDAPVGCVYKWRSTQGTQRQRSMSVTSYTSTDGETSSAHNSEDRFRHRYPRRKATTQRNSYSKRKSDDSKEGKTSGALKLINLSDKILTPAQSDVLGLGLTFSPASSFNEFTVIKDHHLFARKL